MSWLEDIVLRLRRRPSDSYRHIEEKCRSCLSAYNDLMVSYLEGRNPQRSYRRYAHTVHDYVNALSQQLMKTERLQTQGQPRRSLHNQCLEHLRHSIRLLKDYHQKVAEILEQGYAFDIYSSSLCTKVADTVSQIVDTSSYLRACSTGETAQKVSWVRPPLPPDQQTASLLSLEDIQGLHSLPVNNLKKSAKIFETELEQQLREASNEQNRIDEHGFKNFC